VGRIFETRKHTMMARWDRMAKVFTRVAKEIAIAVKQGGPNVEYNPSLRRAIQNARSANMPKDKIDGAIKRASGNDVADYTELIYEGYAPHGIAVIVECATDNPTRTVANVRAVFKRFAGNMGATGSVSFMFKKMGVFRLDPEGIDADALELDLIDFGLEEMGETTGEKGEPQILVRCAFNDFGQLQHAIEARGITPISAASEYVADNLVHLDEAQALEVLALVDKMEQDDDVQNVFHNLG
jgi:YebC/PmpR family DNA-binding regulatory protein